MANPSFTLNVNGNTAQLQREIDRIARKDITLNLKTATSGAQPLGKVTGQITEIDKSLAAANARVIAFGASAGVIVGLESAVSSLFNSFVNTEKKLTDINVLLNLTDKSLAKFGSSLFDIAGNTAQSFDVVATAATELSRQGLGVEETLKRTQAALILTRLSGLDAAASVSALTAAMNSFQSSALDSTEIINKMANVDAAFAVSSADLANAISRVGSSAEDAGVSFDQLIALVTTAQQVTSRGGSVIGNSLKTIFTRLSRDKTGGLLESVGIARTDSSGQEKGKIAILQELAKKYDTLGSSQKSYVAEQLGGVFQINILKAALNDLGRQFSIYDQALQTSVGSTDEAIKRNEALNQTLSALASKTMANAQKSAMGVGEGLFGKAARNTLNIANMVSGVTNDTESQSIGGKIGKGLVDGIGNFIAGPGLALVTATILKLLGQFSQYGAEAARGLLGINKASKDQAVIQQNVIRFLQENQGLYAGIVRGQVTATDAAKVYLGVIQQQTHALEAQKQIAGTIATGLVGNVRVRDVAGERVVVAKAATKTAADGFLPAVAAEHSNISSGVGGARLGDRPVQIRNFSFGSGQRGNIVAHTGEWIVPNFAGSGGSAIFNRDMVSRMGLPAGARKITAADGSIPSFAVGKISQIKSDSSGNLRKLFNVARKEDKDQDGRTVSDSYETAEGIVRVALPHTLGEYGVGAEGMLRRIVKNKSAAGVLYKGKSIEDYINKKIDVKKLIDSRNPNDVASNIGYVKGAMGEIDMAQVLASQGIPSSKLPDSHGMDAVSKDGKSLYESKVKNKFVSDEIIIAKALTHIGMQAGGAYKNETSDKIVIPPSQLFYAKNAAGGFVPNFAFQTAYSQATPDVQSRAKQMVAAAKQEGKTVSVDAMVKKIQKQTATGQIVDLRAAYLHSQSSPASIFRGDTKDGVPYAFSVGGLKANVNFNDKVEQYIGPALNKLGRDVFPSGELNRSDAFHEFNSGAQNTLGRLFENVAYSVLNKSAKGNNSVFDLNGSFINSHSTMLGHMFNMPSNMRNADFKLSPPTHDSGDSNVRSFLGKIMAENGIASSIFTKSNIKNAANGFIPNFAAHPLSRMGVQASIFKARAKNEGYQKGMDELLKRRPSQFLKWTDSFRKQNDSQTFLGDNLADGYVPNFGINPDSLRAMASQTASPMEAAIARKKLAAMESKRAAGVKTTGYSTLSNDPIFRKIANLQNEVWGTPAGRHMDDIRQSMHGFEIGTTGYYDEFYKRIKQSGLANGVMPNFAGGAIPNFAANQSLQKELVKKFYTAKKSKDDVAFNPDTTVRGSVHAVKSKSGSEVAQRQLLRISSAFDHSLDDPASPFLFRGTSIEEITNLRRLGETTSLGTHNADNLFGSFVTSSFAKAAGFGLDYKDRGFSLVLDKSRALSRPHTRSVDSGFYGLKQALFSGAGGQGQPIGRAFPSEQHNTAKVGRITRDDILGIIDLKNRRVMQLEEFSKNLQQVAQPVQSKAKLSEIKQELERVHGVQQFSLYGEEGRITEQHRYRDGLREQARKMSPTYGSLLEESAKKNPDPNGHSVRAYNEYLNRDNDDFWKSYDPSGLIKGWKEARRDRTKFAVQNISSKRNAEASSGPSVDFKKLRKILGKTDADILTYATSWSLANGFIPNFGKLEDLAKGGARIGMGASMSVYGLEGKMKDWVVKIPHHMGAPESMEASARRVAMMRKLEGANLDLGGAAIPGRLPMSIGKTDLEDKMAQGLTEREALFGTFQYGMFGDLRDRIAAKKGGHSEKGDEIAKRAMRRRISYLRDKELERVTSIPHSDPFYDMHRPFIYGEKGAGDVGKYHIEPSGVALGSGGGILERRVAGINRLPLAEKRGLLGPIADFLRSQGKHPDTMRPGSGIRGTVVNPQTLGMRVIDLAKGYIPKHISASLRGGANIHADIEDKIAYIESMSGKGGSSTPLYKSLITKLKKHGVNTIDGEGLPQDKFGDTPFAHLGSRARLATGGVLDVSSENAVGEIASKKITDIAEIRRLLSTSGALSRDSLVNFRSTHAGGLIPNFANKIGYLDGDVLSDPKNADIVSAEIAKLGLKGGTPEYHKYLGSLLSKAREQGKLKRYSFIYGVPGSGKSTLMMGGKPGQGGSQQNPRVPILRPSDIGSIKEAIDTRASTEGTLTALAPGGYLNNVDRAFILSSTTDEEKAEVVRRRRLRDSQIKAGTAATSFGRNAGTSLGSPVDSSLVEAAASYHLGDKARFLGIRPGFKLQDKEAPSVTEKKIGLLYGALAPSTVGHLANRTDANKLGIADQDFIAMVSREGGRIDPNDPHSFRTAIFTQKLRKTLAELTFAGSSVSAAAGGNAIGSAIKFIKTGDRTFVKPAEGSTIFLGKDDNKEKSAEQYKDLGFNVHFGERQSGVSGTDLRDAIFSGNIGAIRNLMTPEAAAHVESILPQIQNRNAIMPKILERVDAKVGVGLAEIERRLAQYPARLTAKIKAENPEFEEKVMGLRGERDDLKRQKQKLPVRYMRRLGGLFPSKYGNFADGYVPNFADPLSDAIGREMSAGVSRNQIYVKDHSILKSSSNPMGLGVFNNRDEGTSSKEIKAIKDRGYAGGYVPNFAEDVAPSGGNPITDYAAIGASLTGAMFGLQFMAQGLRSSGEQFKDLEANLKKNNVSLKDAIKVSREDISKRREAIEVQSGRRNNLIESKTATLTQLQQKYYDPAKDTWASTDARDRAAALKSQIAKANNVNERQARALPFLASQEELLNYQEAKKFSWKKTGKFMSEHGVGLGFAAQTFSGVAGQLAGGPGTKYGEIANTVGNVAGFAGAGSIGGKLGTGLGAVAGLAMSLPALAKALDENAKKASMRASTSNERFGSFQNASQSVLVARQNLEEKKSSGGSSIDIKKMESKYFEALSQLPAEYQKQILSAKNLNDAQEVLAEALKKEALSNRGANAAADIANAPRGIFSSGNKLTNDNPSLELIPVLGLWATLLRKDSTKELGSFGKYDPQTKDIASSILSVMDLGKTPAERADRSNTVMTKATEAILSGGTPEALQSLAETIGSLDGALSDAGKEMVEQLKDRGLSKKESFHVLNKIIKDFAPTQKNAGTAYSLYEQEGAARKNLTSPQQAYIKHFDEINKAMQNNSEIAFNAKKIRNFDVPEFNMGISRNGEDLISQSSGGTASSLLGRTNSRIDQDLIMKRAQANLSAAEAGKAPFLASIDEAIKGQQDKITSSPVLEDKQKAFDYQSKLQDLRSGVAQSTSMEEWQKVVKDNVGEKGFNFLPEDVQEKLSKSFSSASADAAGKLQQTFQNLDLEAAKAKAQAAFDAASDKFKSVMSKVMGAGGGIENILSSDSIEKMKNLKKGIGKNGYTKADYEAQVALEKLKEKTGRGETISANDPNLGIVAKQAAAKMDKYRRFLYGDTGPSSNFGGLSSGGSYGTALDQVNNLFGVDTGGKFNNRNLSSAASNVEGTSRDPLVTPPSSQANNIPDVTKIINQALSASSAAVDEQFKKVVAASAGVTTNFAELSTQIAKLSSVINGLGNGGSPNNATPSNTGGGLTYNAAPSTFTFAGADAAAIEQWRKQADAERAETEAKLVALQRQVNLDKAKRTA